MKRIYACIDLKSYYASCECVLRALDPLTTNLVVADSERTEKTICLAVSPTLKSFGISGRARLFEVLSKVREINEERRIKLKSRSFTGKSFNYMEIMHNPNLELDFIIAKPRMKTYIKYSTDIYNIYLKYLSKEDIYVYSIDEVFLDLTDYLKYQKLTPKDFVTKIIQDIIKITGITATAGIGTNLYLAKVAMDIMAKHTDANKDGVRVAMLDEMTYRQNLWNHQPLTDFWRVGKGYYKTLKENKMYTMGDICRISLKNENILYNLFGVNAEILIDHAWGYEPCTIKNIKNYKPKNNSLSRGQVLHEAYDYQKTKTVILEMSELLSLDLVEYHFITDEIVLTINYDTSNITSNYIGEVIKDYYGRLTPKHAHGSIQLNMKTSSTKIIMEKTLELFNRIINPNLLVRRINIAAINLLNDNEQIIQYEQINLFDNHRKVEEQKELLKEKEVQKTIINIKKKYGKNAILRGINFDEGSTAKERNEEIGGHHA